MEDKQEDLIPQFEDLDIKLPVSTISMLTKLDESMQVDLHAAAMVSCSGQLY